MKRSSQNAEKVVPGSGAPASPIKTTINLSADSLDDLKKIAADRGTTVADVIRKAVWIESYLHEEIKKGSKILVKGRDQSIKELVIR
jgi:hypothetical protein